MKLIVVLVAILSKKLNLIPVWLHDDRWLGIYLDKMKQYGLFSQSNRPLQMLLMCLPIVALIGLSYWSFGNWLFGLVGVAISVLVVQFAFGARDLDDELGEYLLFWRANKKDEYRQKAKEFFALGSWGASDEDMHKAVFGQVLQRSCYYLFTPLFWFWVFGPMGAVICGLCSLTARQGSIKPYNPKVDEQTKDSKSRFSKSRGSTPLANELIQFARQLQETVAWLPARMMALSFSVTGHFSTVFKPAINSFSSLDQSTYDVLEDCASEALTLLPLVDDRDEMREQAERQMLGLQSLLNRTLGFWLVGMAVFTIFGLTN